MKKRLIITEEEQNRILKMHKTAINDSYLNNFNGKKLQLKNKSLMMMVQKKHLKKVKLRKKLRMLKKKEKRLSIKLKMLKMK